MTPASGGCGFIPKRLLERLAKHRCLDLIFHGARVCRVLRQYDLINTIYKSI